jgi:hypothetical protein
MSRFLNFEECPRCVEQGRDRSRDNLGVYSDGGAHCWSCGYHKFPKFQFQIKQKEIKDDSEKAVLPSDFTREVPAECWRWLLQYGLPISYWRSIIGYSPKYNRLVFTFGNPIRFSIGRAFNKEDRKWCFWGDGHKYVETLGSDTSKTVVLVEDLISAHKVAQVTSCICLFGTNIHDVAIKELIKLKKPVVLWLDNDQYSLLSKKIGRLQTLLSWPVSYINTEKDPKEYSIEEVKEILK